MRPSPERRALLAETTAVFGPAVEAAGVERDEAFRVAHQRRKALRQAAGAMDRRNAFTAAVAELNPEAGWSIVGWEEIGRVYQDGGGPSGTREDRELAFRVSARQIGASEGRDPYGPSAELATLATRAAVAFTQAVKGRDTAALTAAVAEQHDYLDRVSALDEEHTDLLANCLTQVRKPLEGTEALAESRQFLEAYRAVVAARQRELRKPAKRRSWFR